MSWLAPRLLCSLTLLPLLLVGLPRIHGLAWFVVTLGIAARLVPTLERHAAGCRRLLRFSFPVVAGLVPILAATLWGETGSKNGARAPGRFPSPGSPNVLLIVLDTVAADHLSLYGYERPTSPTMVELAERGIRFDRVQATSSWTLPSHASHIHWTLAARAFRRLAHPAGWDLSNSGRIPRVARLRHGGFRRQLCWYCASDSGLERGFVTYQDYIFPGLTAFKAAVPGRSVRERGSRRLSVSSRIGWTSTS